MASEFDETSQVRSSGTVGAGGLQVGPAVPQIGRDRLPSVIDVAAAVAALKDRQVYDYLRVKTNKDWQKFIVDEKRFDQGKGVKQTPSLPMRAEVLLFADSVIKVNRKGKEQGRHLVITDQALYNFLPKKYNKCQRRIPIGFLGGVVLSKTSDEMVFQVADDYDYRYVIQRRAEVVEMVSKCFEIHQGKSLPLHLVEESKLDSYTITKDKLEDASGALSSHTSFDSFSGKMTPKVSTVGDSGKDGISFLAGKGSKSGNHIIGGFRKPGTILEGWLSKRKGTARKYDRKYFVLDDKSLRYYTPYIKGQVKISGDSVAIEKMDTVELGSGATPGGTEEDDASAAVVDDGSSEKPRTINKLEWAMKITTSDRSKPLYVAAETKEDYERWRSAFENKVTEEEQEFVHLEGWLLKKVPAKKIWRRRYFVIIKDRCWYFEMAVKGSIDLKQGVSAHSTKTVSPTETSHANFAGMTSRTRFAYRFVCTGERLYKLGADSAHDMNRWLSEIEKVCREHTQGMPKAQTQGTEAILPEEMKDAILEEAPEGEVTFVFTDVQSSTNLWEAVPDAMDESLTRHDAIMRRLLKKYRGYEVKTEGDAFMVTFFSAMDAIMWCMDVQITLCQEKWPDDFLQQPGGKKELGPKSGAVVFNGIRVRMGIHTGNPNCRRNPVTGRMDYFGPVVNRSARVSDTGHGGQITITEESLAIFNKTPDERLQEFSPQIKHLGHFYLKGIKEEVAIYELLPKLLMERSDLFPPIRATPAEKGQAPPKAVQEKGHEEEALIDDDDEEDKAVIDDDDDMYEPSILLVNDDTLDNLAEYCD